jgi:hypothetical protein
MEELQNRFDTSQHMGFHAAKRGQTECGQLFLQFTDVMPSKREVVNEIAHAFLVQRALNEVRFELALQTKQISVNRFELLRKLSGQRICGLPITARCDRLVKSWLRRLHSGIHGDHSIWPLEAMGS